MGCNRPCGYYRHHDVMTFSTHRFLVYRLHGHSAVYRYHAKLKQEQRNQETSELSKKELDAEIERLHRKAEEIELKLDMVKIKEIMTS
jgi:hypothetical protein